MITTNGRAVIKRFFGGQISQIGGSIGLGVGVTPVTAGDLALDYEVLRVPVVAINGDVNNDRTVFKARVEPGSLRRVYEIALYETTQVGTPNRMMSIFGDAAVWTDGVLEPVNARAGVNSLRVDYVAGGTTTAELTGMDDNMSDFADNSLIIAGVEVGDNLSSLRLRLGTDSSNYFEFLFDDLVAGYNVIKAVRSTATVTGTPTWESIRYVAVRPSATADGPGSIHFDGLRLEQPAPGQLVARSVLDEPIEIDPDIASDVEYALRIAFA